MSSGRSDSRYRAQSQPDRLGTGTTFAAGPTDIGELENLVDERGSGAHRRSVHLRLCRAISRFMVLRTGCDTETALAR